MADSSRRRWRAVNGLDPGAVIQCTVLDVAYRKVTRSLEAADGTPISYHTHLGTAGGDEAALVERRSLLLTNGIGTSENFWRHLVEALSEDHRVVHWDYRGHGASGVARSGDYSLKTQAGDLIRVTESVMRGGRPGLGSQPPVQVAFSMGVPVLLEVYRVRPDLVPCMVLIAGAPDAPWNREGVFKLPAVGAAVRGALRGARPLLPALRPLWRAALNPRLIYPAGRLIGQIRARAERRDIAEFMAALKRMDLGAYWGTLIALFDADAGDVLPQVKVPVLILGAENDGLIPLRQVERMRDALPHARWHLVRDAGHGTLIEAGPEIAGKIRDFLGEARA